MKTSEICNKQKYRRINVDYDISRTPQPKMRCHFLPCVPGVAFSLGGAVAELPTDFVTNLSRSDSDDIAPIIDVIDAVAQLPKE